MAPHERIEWVSELFEVAGEGAQVQTGLRVEPTLGLPYMKTTRAIHLTDRSEDRGVPVGIAFSPPPFRWPSDSNPGGS